MTYRAARLAASLAVLLIFAGCSDKKDQQETPEVSSVPADVTPAEPQAASEPPPPAAPPERPRVEQRADMSNPLEQAIAAIPPADRQEFVKSFSCYVKEPEFVKKGGQIQPSDIQAIHKKMMANGGRAWC